MKKTHTVKALVCAGVLLAAAFTSGNLAQAQTCTATWTGNAGNGSWSTPGNWSPKKVPGASSDVCIPTFDQAQGAGLDGSSSTISVHSIQVAEGGAILFGSGKVSIATSLINEGLITLYGTTMSAASIDNPSPGQISVYDNSTITSPAFSNPSGTVDVGPGVTLKLTDNPVQLSNGNLSGGFWFVDGVLVIPGEITELTGQGTGVDIDNLGAAIENVSGNNALATLTRVGPGASLSVVYSGTLTVEQALTNQGVVNVGSGSGGTLTVNGSYTQTSGSATNFSVGTLSAAAVTVESGSTLGGQGTIESSVTNNGTVSPTNLTVTGSYTQSSAAALTEQFSTTLNVSGTATLSGALNITINPKRPPKSGQSYTALTAGSISGSFTRTTTGYTVTTNGNTIVVTKQ
jgi:fibronectin-binding autotransporter adhesin